MEREDSHITLQQALQVIETKCYSFEVREEAWEAEKSTMQFRIKVLESEKERQNYIILHQARRIEMLENALQMERSLHGKQPDTSEASEISKSYDKFLLSRTKQQETVKNLVTELHHVSSELSTLLEQSVFEMKSFDVPPNNEKQKSGAIPQNPAPSTETSLHEIAKKEVKKEAEPIEISFLQKKSPLSEKKSVSTILDMLRPTTPEEDEWGDEPEPKTKRTASSEALKKQGRRSASDNALQVSKGSIQQEKEAFDGLQSQNALNSIAHSLEDDDSFLDSSFEKNYSTWKQTSTVRAHFDAIRSLDFHRELPIIVSASDDCTLKIWNIEAVSKKVQAESIHTYYGHKKAVLHCAMDTRGKYFYSGSLDHTIMQWRLPENLESPDPFASYGRAISHHVRTLTGHRNAVWDVCPQESTPSIICSASSDGTVKIWNTRKKSPHQCLETIQHPSNDCSYIPTSLSIVKTNTNQLLAAYNDSSISVIDLETCRVVQRMNDNGQKIDRSSQINQVVNHHCKPMAFTAHEDRYIRYYDLRNGECSHSMVAHLESVSSLSVDPRGDHLLSGGHDCSLRVWDIRKKACTQELMANRKKFDESIECVTVHPKLNLIASSGADSNIKFLKQSLPITTVP